MTLSHGAGVDWPGPEDGDVLASVVGEAAEAVEELELRRGGGGSPRGGGAGAGARRRAGDRAPGRSSADDLIGEACRGG